MSNEAMKLALEALVKLSDAADGFSVSGVYFNEEHWAKECLNKSYDAITALRQSIEQAQQAKPAAMRYDFDGYGYKYIDSGSGSDWQTRIKDAEPMFASPPPQHALMADHWKEQYEQMKAQRQWVGLTDEEVRDVYQNYMENPDDTWDYERAIEAKLKEKNT